MAESNDKVKKLLDIKAKNTAVRSKVRKAEPGMVAEVVSTSNPATVPVVAAYSAATPAQRDELLGGPSSFDGYTLHSARDWTRENISYPLLKGVDAVIDWGGNVMNSVRGAIGGAMLKAGAKVSGTYVPEERRLTSNKQPSDNNDNKGGGGKKWPWIVGILGASGGAYGLFGGSRNTERNDNTLNVDPGTIRERVYNPNTGVSSGRTSEGNDTTWKNDYVYEGEYTNSGRFNKK